MLTYTYGENKSASAHRVGNQATSENSDPSWLRARRGLRGLFDMAKLGRNHETALRVLGLTRRRHLARGGDENSNPLAAVLPLNVLVVAASSIGRLPRISYRPDPVLEATSDASSSSEGCPDARPAAERKRRAFRTARLRDLPSSTHERAHTPAQSAKAATAFRPGRRSRTSRARASARRCWPASKVEPSSRAR